VRSFLDHDRPYRPPLDHAAVSARSHLAYHGVYVDREGRSLPPAAVVQSLVEHLKGWSAVIGHHGLMMLEVHCLEPGTIARFINQCESLHMDAYHRFSQQLLVEADRFIMAAAESGLYPDWAAFRKYPTRLPYTRITLSYLRKRGYTIRHPGRADVPAMAAFERRCLPVSRAASAGEIGRRVSQYPEGQCLLEVDGRLAAVAYSQRVSHDLGRIEPGDDAPPVWVHAADGAAAELLYAVCPGAEDKALGRDLVTFMRHYVALKDGVEVVIGEARCERSLELSERGQGGMTATLRDYMDGQAIDAEADTRAPEAELSAFGTRWLLRIFQDMGVMTTPDQVYDLPDLIRRLGILPKYERLCAALLRLLAREQVLRLSGECIQMLPRASTLALRDVETECGRFAADFCASYAAFQPLLELMYRCLGQFADVLTGRIEANDVVFPHGSMDAFAGMFRGNRAADYFNGLVAEIVLARMTMLRQHSPEVRLSVLEIGAGTGSTTRVVVEKIQHLAGAFTFCYSDISSAFTRRGEKTFGARFPWMTFARLNIEEDLLAQGFQPESFDLVYAANVLHDTRSIAHTLTQVKALLKPGGLLIVNEFTAMKDFLLFTGALLHGYWLFEDSDLRLQDSCLLSVDRWQEALTAAGFQQVEALGLPGQPAPTAQSVMLC
jgi:SAM-dependent methyltransferase